MIVIEQVSVVKTWETVMSIDPVLLTMGMSVVGLLALVRLIGWRRYIVDRELLTEGRQMHNPKPPKGLKRPPPPPPPPKLMLEAWDRERDRRRAG